METWLLMHIIITRYIKKFLNLKNEEKKKKVKRKKLTTCAWSIFCFNTLNIASVNA